MLPAHFATPRLRRALLPAAVLAAAAALAVALVAAAPRRAAGASTTYTTLASLERDFGDPPGTTFARLQIPSLGVNAPVGQSVAGTDGNMSMPQGPADVMWYDLSQWYALGGAPGAGGNAVFSGHLDYVANVPYAGVRYDGPGVFARIHELRIGDEIDVAYQGQTLRYFVTWNRDVPPDSNEWPSIFSNQVGIDSITLFTCGGTFNLSTRDYSTRVAVRAERIEGTPAILPKPAPGGFTYGRAGTNNPVALAAAQNFAVQSVYGEDAATRQWLVYIPGAPAFVDTLVGHLDPAALVIIVRQAS